ncbi:hypothetical protein DICPUDRAFT_91339 [Dictyostelium purpureum]|uniref:DUF6748 domain-containing protein n=1 Tax=Dictyostelium purpureum TaxID=5786 RepID=F0ZAW0_DICPU|nr:uncharacterized protein DICPUDRAFT_91339 [Dictyostelium purpureum]EGC38871.1 hypothetical protein DICPUDRAFT_91339 [Dictyostelium purpureum]|eukprot:XP_003284551.1 hypothetical protein DICPUDRAFT_91339 [Dictyostelium purpureum]
MKLLICLLILLTINLVYSKEEWFFLRPDFRKCAAPLCGGNFLTKVNDQEGKEYHQVQTSLVDATINMSLLEDYANIIVLGELEKTELANDPSGEYYSLFLKGIYHTMGLPPQSPNPKMIKVRENYYMLSAGSCNSDFSTCSGIKAALVNSNTNTPINSYVNPYTTVPLLDSNWFTSRLLGKSGRSAIAKGYIVGNKLTISMVYISSSDPSTACPTNTISCPTNQIPAFTRKDNSRCPIFDGCTPRGPCPLYIPHCQDGYTLYRLPNKASRGCPKYYCDPSFLIDPVKASNP